MRRVVPALVAALLALGLLAGCGGGDDGDEGGGGDDPAELKERFDRGFRPINEQFLTLGRETGQAIDTARGKSNEALASQFKSISTRLAALRARFDALEPPPEYERAATRVSSAMALVGGGIDDIAQAAAIGDAAEARTQTEELVRHSREVGIARRALARKTGATV